MSNSQDRQRIPVVTSVSIFLESLWRDRSNLLGLVKWDFREAYLGTYIGLAWAFLKPLLYLTVISIGLSQGFGMKSPVEGFALHTWLVCGLLPWLFISESLSSPIHSIVEHSYLVKKIKFNVSLIPLTKVLSALVIHVLLSVLFIVFLLAIGKHPTWHWFQLPYLILCATLLLCALGLFSASVYVFTRDIGQVFNLLTTLTIWVTPVFWSSDMLKGSRKILLYLNPFAYIVEGYRDSLIHGRWLFADPRPTLFFWALTLGLLTASILIFRRLNNHFADAI